jgi:uncharacterized protein
MKSLGIVLDRPRLEKLCQRWEIIRLGLFGSVLEKDFGPESDVDCLVTFSPEATWSLFDLIDLKAGLAEVFGRDVDLVEERAIRNPYRRRTILETRKIIYEAS